MSPRRHLERLIEQWPQISSDLVALPEVMHRVLRRVVEEEQAPASRTRVDDGQSRRSAPSWGRPSLGGLLAVGGGAWLALSATPAWAGWLALGAGLGLLAGLSRRGS